MRVRQQLPALVAVSLGLAACGSDPYAFIEADDVRMEPVQEYTLRQGGEYGDIYVLSLQGAHEVNGWVGEAVEGAGRAMQLLDRLPGKQRDGWKVYGPYDDWTGRDLAWLVKIRGDETGSTFEAHVGSRGAKREQAMDLFLDGELVIAGPRREGTFAVDFDAIERHPEMKSGPNVDRQYTGRVEVGFVRDVDTEFKHVDLDFENFSVTEEYPVPDFFAAERYSFHRNADGGGDFEVALSSTFQTLIWSGPEVEEMRIQMAWNPDGSGRALGELRETDEGGDLTYGDMVIEECFDDGGFLSWRFMSEAYAELFPDYPLGDPSLCVLDL